MKKAGYSCSGHHDRNSLVWPDVTQATDSGGEGSASGQGIDHLTEWPSGRSRLGRPFPNQ